ncbi:hypothetical protein SAMN06297164_0315 [Nitrosomonas ureae]|uniref:Uncharacterized protein n=1 Tax=Nitrosomonas ureae TaxID=44577 RepID=A0A286A325_9PROT|nr:hypothetical protein SAMN06297164_0315 [Nitrosomonas ureae]
MSIKLYHIKLHQPHNKHQYNSQPSVTILPSQYVISRNQSNGILISDKAVSALIGMQRQAESHFTQKTTVRFAAVIGEIRNDQ